MGSSVIRGAWYVSDRKELCLLFVSGRRYVYSEVPSRVADGFADAVVWNPWADLARQLPDLADDEYLRMLCVEAANAATSVRLDPGARWIGTQTLRREG